VAPATRPNARKPATGWPGRRPSRAGLRERVGRNIPAVGHARARQGARGNAHSAAIGPDRVNETARRFPPAGFSSMLIRPLAGRYGGRRNHEAGLDDQLTRVLPEYAPARKRLFRFWDARSAYFKLNLERLLRNDELFLSSRKSFNDPFDVNPIIKSDWTASGIRAHLANIIENPGSAATPHTVLKTFFGGVTHSPQLSLQKIRDLKNSFPGYMAALFDKLGICCFTEEMQNPIFWAHYAGSYSGVCAEFAATGDDDHLFRHVMKVHYTAHRPSILASQTGALGTVYGKNEDWTHIAQYGVCTKSSDWSVEREWRWWLADAAQQFRSLPLGALKRILIGPKASDDTRSFILGLGKSSGGRVGIFETRLSSGDFRVERARRLR
jgi:hypothetical protein